MLVDDADLRPALGRHLAAALDPGRQRIARPHRLQPTHLVEAGRAQGRAFVEVVVDEQAHQLGRNVPARGDQPTEHRLPGGLGIEVKALRIVLTGEGNDLVGGEGGGAERVFRAHLVVFPVARDLGLHRWVIAEHGPRRKAVYGPPLWSRGRASVSLPIMDEPTLVRRLTTIVSVDVVGFSTMSARNEEHALELLAARMATVESLVKH